MAMRVIFIVDPKCKGAAEWVKKLKTAAHFTSHGMRIEYLPDGIGVTHFGRPDTLELPKLLLAKDIEITQIIIEDSGVYNAPAYGIYEWGDIVATVQSEEEIGSDITAGPEVQPVVVSEWVLSVRGHVLTSALRRLQSVLLYYDRILDKSNPVSPTVAYRHSRRNRT